jgi:hypothetical protein
MKSLPIRITRFVKIGQHRWNFDISLSLSEEEAIEIRACALVESYAGGYSVYGPSRYNGEWTPLVVWPTRIHSAVREAALQALEAMEPAGVE